MNDQNINSTTRLNEHHATAVLVPWRQDGHDGVVERSPDGRRRQVVALVGVGEAELVVRLYLKR